MSPEGLQKELRRILNTSSIEVKKDPAWAVRNRHHPHALQVWDKGVQTGKPYVVAVLENSRGYPCEPGPQFFSNMWKMLADNIHRGRPGWADKQEFDARDHTEWVERENDRRFHERVSAERGRIFSMLGHNKYWSLDRTMRKKQMVTQ